MKDKNISNQPSERRAERKENFEKSMGEVEPVQSKPMPIDVPVEVETSAKKKD